MNAKLTKLVTQLAGLDSWTQLSILGSWHYTVNSSCINAAMRFIPEVEEGSGIDGVGRFEQARIALVKDADESQLPGLIAVQREIGSLILGNNGEVRGLENTLTFMIGNKPKRETFGREFEERRRLGMRPGITKEAFMEIEFKRAMERHEKLIALGGDAVRLCETITLDRHLGDAESTHDGTDLPDWIIESFERKLIEKLHARWDRIELTRTNPRMKKSIRDDAEADQLLIEKLLGEYGETPGITEKERIADDKKADDFLKEAGDMSKLDVVKPTPNITSAE